MTDEFLQLAAVVAALVGVLKTFKVPSKYNHFAALAISAVFVLAPASMRDSLVAICTIGLTASGAYHYTKKQEG